MISSIVTAFRILTIIPVPGRECAQIRTASFFFPLVGLVLGGVVVLFAWALGFLEQPDYLVASVIGVGVMTWLTGALHLDGIGDVADAFGGGSTRERVLEILKDSRMGVFGVAAIVFDIVLKITCWRHLLERDREWVIVYSLVLSRSIQALMAAYLPPARNDGRAAAFCGYRLMDKAIVTVTALAVIAAFLLLDIPRTLFATISSVTVVTVFVVWSLRRIRGITGDCLGAGSELTELIVLLGGMV